MVIFFSNLKKKSFCKVLWLTTYSFKQLISGPAAGNTDKLRQGLLLLQEKSLSQLEKFRPS